MPSTQKNSSKEHRTELNGNDTKGPAQCRKPEEEAQ